MAYRYQPPVMPRTPIWWAGWVGYAALGLSVLLWTGMLVGAYHRESWGMLGARIAIGPTAFALGTLVLARRTRYARSPAARIAAPLALGWLAAYVCILALELFFAVLWEEL